MGRKIKHYTDLPGFLKSSQITPFSFCIIEIGLGPHHKTLSRIREACRISSTLKTSAKPNLPDVLHCSPLTKGSESQV